MKDVSDVGGGMSTLGGDLMAKMARLAAMDAEAGITYDGSDQDKKDDWRKELQGASKFSVPEVARVPPKGTRAEAPVPAEAEAEAEAGRRYLLGGVCTLPGDLAREQLPDNHAE